VRLICIADQRHPIWDGTGASLFGGRWNSPGRMVIYASQSYSCAMLELLVHSNIGRVPLTHQAITVDVPESIKIEKIELTQLPIGWDWEANSQSRAVGDQWMDKKRSVILLVPSVVVKMEWNAVVNPAHPDFNRLVVSESVPVVWDKRLFERDSK
jgi:RES domain-containing protein